MTAPNTKASDTEWAEKLRRENCDQFNTLVRMHLSFVLDQNTDDYESTPGKVKLKKWTLIPFYKKPKCLNKGIMEGAPLTQEGICQVYQLIEYLKQETNISVEGVFRRTGALSRQQELRALLNRGTVLCLEDGTYSVHDCASVLKGFLAELPEPLLTDAHYAAHCQIAELFVRIDRPSVETRLLRSLQLLLLLLPTENRVLLRDVLDLLHLTTTYERCNKMSADSLATLFTPHLLCPRKLSPESLHYNSQTLSVIVAFMIRNVEKLFDIPPQLAVDVRTYFTKRNVLRSPNRRPQPGMDESVGDNMAANTVFSFVDKERTAKENQSNPTETALAQLYAHIQSLPESSKKRKLVKQFNKENGQGTPLQMQRRNDRPTTSACKTIGLGESIKRRIFQKTFRQTGTPRLTQLLCIDEDVSSTKHATLRTKLFCTDCEVSSDMSAIETNGTEKTVTTTNVTTERRRRRRRSDLDDVKNVFTTYLTSTPAVTLQVPATDFTPSDQSRSSMSPITCSTQRMCKAMQETMMTPRSRKPVLLISRTNICMPTIDGNVATERVDTVVVEDDTPKLVPYDSEPFKAVVMKKSKSLGDIPDGFASNNAKLTASTTCDSLTSTFREYLCSRSVFSECPVDLSFSSRTDDYDSIEWKDLSEDKLSESLLYCLDGNRPNSDDVSVAESNGDGVDECSDCAQRKRDSDSLLDDACTVDAKKYILGDELVLKPNQFNERGEPIVYETSF